MKRSRAIVLSLVCWSLASLGASPAASAISPPGLRLAAKAPDALLVTLSKAPRGATRRGRYRAAGERRWHVRALGRATSWRIGGLRPNTAYALESRTCAARCSRWSRALHALTASSSTTAPPGVLGCRVFPADNPWNQDISQVPVDPSSAAYVSSIGAGTNLHPDFGANPSYGIPYTVVGPAQPLVPLAFTAYGDQSDPGPYPVPPDAPVEQGSDAHVIVVQRGSCRLYELFNAHRQGPGWAAGAGAVFDLSSNALRQDGWTSADAAGLPIFPGLARYDEVQAGHIDHALRFTVTRTQRGYIHPATHFASSSTDVSLPPMGLRLRLRASFDLGPYRGAALVILQALKRYGMIVADNGSNWYISGATDSRWNDDDLNQLKGVPGGAFEAVQTGPILRSSG